MSDFLVHPVPSESGRPLISVITACFNTVDFIEQCMLSALTQEFGDFEYIVIDGGSTDGTREIVEKYAACLAYWHSRPDRGVAHAFNQGIEHSKGQWLLFLNADDYFADKGVLAGLAAALRKNPQADVVYGQVVMMSREIHPERIAGPYGKPFRWAKFLFTNTIPHQAAATNRAYFSRLGRFREDFPIGMDYEHFLRGGPKLNAQFVPLLVTCTRDGGISRNVWPTLRDWHRARIVSGAMPEPFSWLVYFYIACRTFIGRNWRRMCGRTA